MAHDVFISYSSKDKPVADATCAKLEGRGIRCWIAPRDIVAGDDWGGSIVEAINGARAMVLVFSGNANASQQVKREVERAVNRGIVIIPLRIENVAPEKSLEFFISTPHWLDAFSPPMDRHLTYLGEVIAHILEGKPLSEKPPPPPPPWWYGLLGLAAGAAVLAVLAGIGWFAFFRPPPSFIGTWNATALDIAQFGGENTMINALVPPALLANTLKSPDAKGVLTVNAAGQYTLALSGEDHGTIDAQPDAFTGNGPETLTFTSDVSKQSYGFGLDLYKISSGGGGSGFSPQTDPPPDGQSAWEMMFLQAGQQTGGSQGVFTGKPDYQGTPDAGGNMRTLDLIAGSWGPADANMPSLSTGPDNGVTAALTITAGGHYTLDYTLHETGLWHAAKGNWSRQGSQGATPNYGPLNTDTGTYTFTGANTLSLYDQNGQSTWQRGS